MNIQPPVFSEDMQEISNVIGIEKTINLMREVGGRAYYIPKPDSMIVELYKQLTGKSAREIAKDLKLTPRTVTRALKG